MTTSNETKRKKTKKVSDSILNMEKKINLMSGHIQNTDNNTKVILNAVNRLATEVENLKSTIGNSANNVENQKQAVNDGPVVRGVRIPKPIQRDLTPEDVSKAMSGANEKYAFKANTSAPLKPQPYEPPIFDEMGDRELSEEVVHKGARRHLRVPGKPSNKVSISQQLVYPNGNPIWMAQVEISKDGKVIKQARTNGKGRWVAPLVPGDYSINVVKRVKDDGGEPVQLQYDITVPEDAGSGIMELESPELSF